MILACPACDTKFKIPDGALPPGGRKVRCAKCQHSWHADPAAVAKVQQQLMQAVAAEAARPARPTFAHTNNKADEAEAAAAAALRRSMAVESAPIPARETMAGEDMFDEDGGASGPPVSSAMHEKADIGEAYDPDEDTGDDSVDDTTVEDDSYEDDDFLTRRRADQRRQNARASVDRQRKLISAGWSALLLFWVITLYAFMFEKERMLYKFPGTSPLYSFFGSIDERDMYRPEDGERLTPSKAEAEVYVSAKLDNTRTKLEIINGEEKLVVHGYVENLGETAANVPQVLVQIVDVNGKMLDEWIVHPVGLIIRKQGRAPFTTTRDVPIGIANVAASVIEGSRSDTHGEYP